MFFDLDELEVLGWNGDKFRPHKLIAVLSAIEILEAREQPNAVLEFDSTFKRIYSVLFAEYAGNYGFSCRPHTPFFHLRSSSFWELVPCQGFENALLASSTVGGPGNLNEIVSHAVLSDKFMQSVYHTEKRMELKAKVISEINRGVMTLSFSRIEGGLQEIIEYNPFVAYLNSLQRSGGGNENALAESQACNEQFAFIHEPHPLAEAVFNELSSADGAHVILTGHAGDGKSTLALEGKRPGSDLMAGGRILC